MKLLTILSTLFLTISCAEAKYKGYYKVGTPYTVLGQDFYPKVDLNYNKTGTASWYGQKFHKKKTANGEIFRKELATAAHPTLPLPSIVEVKNLENGKRIKVKVNDRGPFKKSRIIDLSQRASEKLGFMHKGTAKVRVKFLLKETRTLHKKLFGHPML
jgi:rare lipoprotein A